MARGAAMVPEMELRTCGTCRRSIPEGSECAFCVPIAGTTRLRAGYAVIAAVSGWGLTACGSAGACAFIGGDPIRLDAGADEVPALAFPDAAPDAWPGDATADASDAADAADGSTDAAKDAGSD